MIAVLKTELPNTLPLDQIRIDGGTQPRSAVNAEYIQELADCLNTGSILPAVTVFYDGESYWLADGFHRYHAHRRTEQIDIAVEIRSGTQRDAVLFSVGANASHGLRRTNEDKRRAVLRLLEDSEWCRWSDREIARRCGVSHNFVSTIRKEYPSLSSDDSENSGGDRTYTTKHGTTATMNTTRIGERSGLSSNRYDQGNNDTDPEDEAPQPAQRYAVALFRRPDLTQAERALKDKYEHCIREIATGEVVPTWEDLRSLYEQFGVWLTNQEAQEEGVIAFGAQSQLKYVVSRPDLNTGKDFPIRLFSPGQAWRFYQDERDRYLGLMERKPMSDEFATPPEPQRNERVENDYYPTPEAITRPLLHLGCIKGQVFEPCAGSGDIAKLFDGCITNELYPRPEFEPDLVGDASDPELWAELDRMGGTDWTVGNTPYGMELPTKILELAAQHSREGVALLLRLGFIEPCQGRRELLAKLADNLRYVIPVNPRPQFRKDTDGTDNVTVAWFVWDFTWSWEDQLIDCPFKFLTDWKEA